MTNLIEFMEKVAEALDKTSRILESIDARLEELIELQFETSGDLMESSLTTQNAAKQTVEELAAIKTEGVKLRPK